MQKKPTGLQWKLALFADIFVIVFGIWGSFLEVYKNGFEMFLYYTTLSNLFMVVCAGVHAYVLFATKKGKEVPNWCRQMKYFGVCCMLMTFVVVVTILAPFSNEHGYYELLWKDALKFQHTMCPVVAVLSFVLLDQKQEPVSKKVSLLALLPTIVYAILVAVLNAAKIIKGPYPFLYVYEQPVWMSVCWFCLAMALIYMLANILRKLSVVMVRTRGSEEHGAFSHASEYRR